VSVEDVMRELVEERSLDALERVTGSRNEEVLEAVIHAAGEILASDALDETDDRIVEELRLHLVDCKAIGMLVDALQTGTPTTKEFALSCLGEIRDTTSLPAMINLLDDEDEGVRAAAAEHLALLTTYDFGQDPAKWREWLAKKVKGELEQVAEDREDQARMLRLQMRGNRSEEEVDTY
jgi:HEAT repeats